MTSRAQKKDMLDYLVAGLGGSDKIEPMKKKFINNIQSSYILVGDSGIVFLVDQVYTGDTFGQILRVMKGSRPNVATIVLKDGETFFRNAAEKNYFKKSHQLSLKNYSAEEMRRMIIFRPEEIAIERSLGRIQYYQPQSANLNQGVVTFKFKDVVYDYSHIDSSRFKPADTESARLKIWTGRKEEYGLIQLAGKYLDPREASQTSQAT